MFYIFSPAKYQLLEQKNLTHKAAQVPFGRFKSDILQKHGGIYSTFESLYSKMVIHSEISMGQRLPEWGNGDRPPF